MAKKKSHEQDIREEARKTAIAELNKKYGSGSIMNLGDMASAEKVPAISTGSIGLDIATGIGGVPRGRIVEIFGPEMSGKTTLALHIVSNVQKAGGRAAYIDAEHAVDPIYASNIGVNLSALDIAQPDSGEQALDIVHGLTVSGGFDVIVVDSVAALTPQKEIEGDMGDSFVGLQARLMGQALRKLTGIASKTKTCIFFINQIREKIGVMYGSNETTPGGRALKFYASMRFDIRKIGDVKLGDKKLGNQTRVKVIKNKCAPPFRQAEFEILFGEGVNYLGEILDVGISEGAIEKSGSWLSYGGERIGQGKENARQYLKENPKILEELKIKVEKIIQEKNKINVVNTEAEEADDDEDEKNFEDDFAVTKG
jgi:recombination protein RecA